MHNFRKSLIDSAFRKVLKRHHYPLEVVVPEKLDFQAANDLNAASSMWQTLKSRCIEMPN